MNILDSEPQLDEGDSFSLVCDATGLPRPEITWLRNGNPVNIRTTGSDRRHVIASTLIGEYSLRSELNVSNANPNSDEGEYLCRIDNHNDENGQPLIASLEITVMGE